MLYLFCAMQNIYLAPCSELCTLGLVELNLAIIRRKPFVYDQNSAKPRSTQHGKNGAHLERVTVVLAG